MLEDGTGLLPTFGPESRETRDARAHFVRLDLDTPDADVRPEPGRLFSLSGILQCTPIGAPVDVTLSSETGRRHTRSACAGEYQFQNLAPALYEVFAVVHGNTEAGFIELFLDRDSTNGTVALHPPSQVTFDLRRAGSNTPSTAPVTILGRRQDLAETDESREIPMPRAPLAPGYWEIAVRPPPGQHVHSVSGDRGFSRRASRIEQPSDWFEIRVQPRFPGHLRITLAEDAGAIEGVVLDERRVIPGAPVFLWPETDAARRALNGSLQALSDTEGRYRFENLPPGEYRLLASFDVSELDVDVLGEARVVPIRLDPGRHLTLPLTLWSAP
jgi:hypothetical protein